jgi:D-alanine-D-alanine ligase
MTLEPHTPPKLRVALLFGGRSAEHEISRRSAATILAALPQDRMEAVCVEVTREGTFLLQKTSVLLQDGATSPVGQPLPPQALTRGQAHGVDVVFPVLHGPYGEDGTVQGLLELAGVPYVGSGVLASAVGMDKDVMKRLLRDAGLKVARAAVLTDPSVAQARAAATTVGYPLFVKPANLGSSVGVSRVNTAQGLDVAVALALTYDVKILLEEAVVGLEAECAVLGTSPRKASAVGAIRLNPGHAFYTYEAKYQDPNAATLEIPAALPPHVTQAIQAMAVRAFDALGCEGLARVDVFVPPDGVPVLNEVNTMPGFTSASMAPRLFEAVGIPLPQLLETMVNLALSRHARRQVLRQTP